MFPCSPVALNSCLYLLEWTRPFLITSFIRILSVSTTKITAISSLVPFLYMRTIDRKRERLWRQCRTAAHFYPGPQINPLDSGWILFLMVSAGFWFLVCVQHLLLYNSVNVQPLHMQPDRNCRAETCVKANEKKSSSAMLNGCNGFFLGPGCTPRLRFMNTGLVIVKFSYFHWLMIEFICQRVNKSATGLTGDYFASHCWCSSFFLCHQLHTGGIIIMKDTSEEDEELVEPVSAHGPKIEEEEQEPEPPEPFEYIDE